MPSKANRIARRNFHVVTYDDDGTPQIDHYYAGDEIDDEVASMIDNPSIFEGEERHSPGNPIERIAARDADDEVNPVAGPGHHSGERRAAVASNNPARLVDADDDDISDTGHGEGVRSQGKAKGKGKAPRSGFGSMTVQELIQFLKDNDVDVPASGRKQDLVEAAEDTGIEPPQDEAGE